VKINRSNHKFFGVNRGIFHHSYTIGKVLGKGGFSVVKEGINIKTQEELAIKIINKEKTNPELLQKELEVLYNLKHDNIVDYKEMFHRRDGYYVVLEKVSGGELFDRIVELQHYSENNARHLIIQTFGAVKYMHDLDIIHRDIKPENLLLSTKANNAIIKITDFGFAVKLKDGEHLTDVLGTLAYMAPEIVKVYLNENDKGYGKPVDIWALGLVLFILLSGGHPFNFEDESDIISSIVGGYWDFDTGFDKISDAAKDLITKMMDDNPDTRFTIQQALDHPWITENIDRREKLTNTQEKIKNFQDSRRKFKKVVRAIIAGNKFRRLTDLVQKLRQNKVNE